MEASGVIFNQPTCVSHPGLCRESTPSFLSAGKACLSGGRRSLVSGFRDNGHLQYYSVGNRVCMAAVREERIATEEPPLKMGKKKKQMKLLKSLSKDLSTFSQMGFGLDLDLVKNSTVSEASEILLERIQKLKAEEKENKRKMKEEKKQMKAAARMKTRTLSGEMSSSSSSESSDSDCGEVVSMNNLRKSTANQDSLKSATTIEDTATPQIPQSSPVLTSDQDSKETLVSDDLCSRDLDGGVSSAVAAISPGKVEVCMGGKCKKSGAASLLEEFQRAIGGEGAVTGCKCMGKCRDGPNVRVVSPAGESADRNPLCIGVGLDDVNMIVANFLGEDRDQISLAPSCS